MTNSWCFRWNWDPILGGPPGPHATDSRSSGCLGRRTRPHGVATSAARADRAVAKVPSLGQCGYCRRFLVHLSSEYCIFNWSQIDQIGSTQRMFGSVILLLLAEGTLKAFTWKNRVCSSSKRRGWTKCSIPGLQFRWKGANNHSLCDPNIISTNFQ